MRQAVFAVLCIHAACAQSLPVEQSVEDEVRGDILAQRVGDWTVRDLKLPDAFVRRVADRLIRASYERHFRIVVRDGAPPPTSASAPASSTSSPSNGSTPANVEWVERPLSVERTAYWSGMAEERPPARGFFARFGEAPQMLADKLPIRFERAAAGAVALAESGDEPLGGFRLQLTRGTDYAGVGDGGSVDIFRQLWRDLPDIPLHVALERRHADDLRREIAGWPVRGAAVRIMLMDTPVAQWAQDNAKSAIIGRDGARGCVSIVPRYASRGEEAPTFVPGESAVIDAWRAGGHPIAQSHLLFQGGNLVIVRDAARGDRVLLIGEAEIARNVALGLSADQARESLCAEFACDRGVVLPAVSFHIDYEVSVRNVGGTTVAFVNDPLAAARIVLRIGVDVLARNGVMSGDQAREAMQHLDLGRDPQFMSLFAAALQSIMVGFGQIPESKSAWFAATPADSGVGNVQRVMLALDLLAAEHAPPTAIAIGREHAYMRSLRRMAADRAALRKELDALGWRVVAVPSIASADRSLNYLNGVHALGVYLMPAYGGLFEPLDDAARRAFAETLGSGVRIVPILCGESQRRDGALRCSVHVLPKCD